MDTDYSAWSTVELVAAYEAEAIAAGPADAAAGGAAATCEAIFDEIERRGPEWVGALKRLLRSPSEPVRLWAATHLLPDLWAQDALQRIEDGGGPLSAAAAKSLRDFRAGRPRRPAPSTGHELEAMVEVYSFAERLLVVTRSRSTTSGWRIDGSVALPRAATDPELGAAVAGAAAQSRGGAPDPGLDEALPADAALLALAGVTSWDPIYRRGSLVSVGRMGDHWSLTAMRRPRRGKRFDWFAGATDEIDSPGDEDLGRAVRAGLARSEAAHLK